MIVIFCGVPGCGKSTVAKQLARRLEDMDLDYEILVSDDISERVYDRVFRFIEANVEETEHLIVDATFYRKKWRDGVRRIAENSGEELITVHLHCSLESSLRRNEMREEEDQVSEKAIHIIYKELEKPDNPNLEFDTDETEPEKVTERVLERILDN